MLHRDREDASTSSEHRATSWENAVQAFRLFHTRNDVEFALQLLAEDVGSAVNHGIAVPELLWDVARDSDAFSMTADLAPISFVNTIDGRYTRRVDSMYRFAMTIGTPGSFGGAVLVYEVSSNPSEVKPQIMKVAVADQTFWDELRFIQHIQLEVLAKRISPHFPIAYDWFITQRMPLSVDGWDTLSDLPFVQRITEETDKTRANKNSYAGLITMEYGYLGAASPSFHEGVIDKMWDLDVKRQVVQMVLFQLVHGLCGLAKSRMQHRDISSVNIVFVDGSKRAALGEAYRQPIVYRVEGEEYAIKHSTKAEQQLEGVFWMPLFIDFSLSEIITSSDDMKLTGPVTRLFSRAPELLFIHEDIADQLEYTDRGDVFSTGMSMVTMMLQENPFLGPGNPAFSTRRFKNFEAELERTCKFGGWSPSRHRYISQFLCREHSYGMARYVWMIVTLIGEITPATLPDAKDTKLYKLVKRFMSPDTLNKPGTLWRPTYGLSRYFGRRGMDLLRRMLAWDPRKRPSPFDLIKDPYFHVLRDTAALLNEAQRGAVWEIDSRAPASHIGETITFPVGRRISTVDHTCAVCERASVLECTACASILCGPECLKTHQCS